MDGMVNICEPLFERRQRRGAKSAERSDQKVRNLEEGLVLYPFTGK